MSGYAGGGHHREVVAPQNGIFCARWFVFSLVPAANIFAKTKPSVQWNELAFNHRMPHTERAGDGGILEVTVTAREKASLNP
ncbi:MAG: hypothetical protein LAP38_25955 [Acidobacteriia bacterium]|nr:hypothetical protein [Terriglobia bacterium]